jgi:adenylate cyclase
MYAAKLRKRTLLHLAVFSLGGASLGLIYIIFEHGFTRIYPFINGAGAGLLVGLIIGLFEVYLFSPRAHQKSFFILLFTRVVIYMVSIAFVILIVVTLTRSIRHHQPLFEALLSEESIVYITQGKFKTAVVFAFIASVLVNFTRVISFKIGRGVLIDFILGVYQKPRLVERVFLLLQITNANQLLKEYTLESYHNFLNKIYKEIAIAAMYNGGYVYEYVDNQIILYWKAPKRGWQSHLFPCYNAILAVMKNNEAYFNKAYNLVPKLVCVAHGGEVVQAEIGELKTEIVFHGDVLNTVGRMMQVAIERGKVLVISEYVQQHIINKEESVQINSIGQIALRGKQQPVDLFSITYDGV